MLQVTVLGHKQYLKEIMLISKKKMSEIFALGEKTETDYSSLVPYGNTSGSFGAIINLPSPPYVINDRH